MLRECSQALWFEPRRNKDRREGRARERGPASFTQGLPLCSRLVSILCFVFQRQRCTAINWAPAQKGCPSVRTQTQRHRGSGGQPLLGEWLMDAPFSQSSCGELKIRCATYPIHSDAAVGDGGHESSCSPGSRAGGRILVKCGVGSPSEYHKYPERP